MFIEINEDLWANLYQANDIQVIDNTEYDFIEGEEFKGFLVGVFMTFGRYVARTELPKVIGDTIREHYTVVNDYHLFPFTFGTGEDARNFVKKILGVYLIDPKQKGVIN